MLRRTFLAFAYFDTHISFGLWSTWYIHVDDNRVGGSGCPGKGRFMNRSCPKWVYPMDYILYLFLGLDSGSIKKCGCGLHISLLKEYLNYYYSHLRRLTVTASYYVTKTVGSWNRVKDLRIWGTALFIKWSSLASHGAFTVCEYKVKHILAKCSVAAE